MPEPESEPLVRAGDRVTLAPTDHLGGRRPLTIDVAKVNPDMPWCDWILIVGAEASDRPDRDGMPVSARVFKKALRRPGVVARGQPTGPYPGLVELARRNREHYPHRWTRT